VPAWLVSLGVHAVVVGLFLLVTFSASAGIGTPLDEPIRTPIDDPDQPLDLTQPIEGHDPQQTPGIPDLPKAANDMPGLDLPNLPLGPMGNPELPFVLEALPGSETSVEASSKATGLMPNASPFEGIVPPGLSSSLFRNGGFGARFARGETRENVLMAGGGNKATEAAVAAGLEWLALHQAPGGGWSMEDFHRYARDQYGPNAKAFSCNCTGPGTRNDVAATALGVLPFLAAGQTHRPIASSKRERDYSKVVDAALRFLITRQDKNSGEWGEMYEHGLATIALCEAYGMTADPGLRTPAQKAINHIVRAQHSGGGWRYRPGQAGDTSVTGWQVMALKSGDLAGLSVPKPALDGATKFLNSVMSKTDFGYGYTGVGSSPRLTAVGLLCREYLGWSARKPELVKGAEIIKSNPPAAKDMYYTYYAAQVMHHLGGDAWRDWNEPMIATLLGARDRGADPAHPHQKGSWDPKGDVYGASWGRVGQTALSVLTLQVYYRHLPLYRREMGTIKSEDEK
jgi:hypothetical protein